MIRSLNCLKDLKPSSSVLLLYSGGLDSTFLYFYLRDLGLNVVPLSLEVGQTDNPIFSPENLIKIDCKYEFLNNYALLSLQNGGKYLGMHPLSASLTRPLFAKKAYQVAKELRIPTIVHSATSHQNSLRRFNGALNNLGFTGSYGSPFAKDDISRSEKILYLKKKGLVVPINRQTSFDSNLIAIECEGGTPEEKIERPQFFYTNQNEFSLNITFEQGKPTKLSSKEVDLISLFNELNRINSVGNYSSFEENQFGNKMLELKSAPAFEILSYCYQTILTKTHSHELILHKNHLDQLWAREASEGRWFGVLKTSIESFNNAIANQIFGDLSLIISNGNIFLDSFSYKILSKVEAA